QRADEERQTPGEPLSRRLRTACEDLGERRGDGPSEGPERFEENDEPAALPRGCELADEGGRNRQLASQAETDENAEEEKAPEPLRKRAQSRGGAEDQEGRLEDALAAEPVGETPRERPTEKHPGEPRAVEDRDAIGPQVPFRPEARHDERHDAAIHGVEQPAETAQQEEPVMEGRERETVQPVGDPHAIRSGV